MLLKDPWLPTERNNYKKNRLKGSQQYTNKYQETNHNNIKDKKEVIKYRITEKPTKKNMTPKQKRTT